MDPMGYTCSSLFFIFELSSAYRSLTIKLNLYPPIWRMGAHMEYVPEIRLFRWFVQAQAILYANYVLLSFVFQRSFL